MKKLFSLITIFCLCTCLIFAEDEYEGDEYDDGYEYDQNGAGGQFLKIDLLANFPLNFNKQVHVGGAVSLGYYRFITKNIALGGDVIVGYNVTIGEKSLITAPITFGICYQPYVGKFEFPLMANIGIATSSCNGMTYFPSFAVKTAGGAYYRFTESWSAGISTDFYWIPQWFSDSKKNDNGMFLSAGISARYHF